MGLLSSVVEVLAAGIAAANPGVPQDAPPRGQDVVRVVAPVAVRGRPGGPQVGRLGTRTRFGSPTRVPVVERRGPWLRVLIPSRRGGRQAWLRRGARLRPATTSVRLTADLSAGRLVFEKTDGFRRAFRLRSGRAATPTPLGAFAVTDRIDGSAYGGVYGSTVIALSGHQPRTPEGWAGGTRLAIHGRAGGGRATRSSGCLVVEAGALRWLARRVPLGTVVRVRA